MMAENLQYSFRYILHLKIIYSSILFLFLFQIASLLFLYKNSSDAVKCKAINSLRSKRQAIDYVSENTVPPFDTTLKKLNHSRKSNEKAKNSSKVLKQDQDDMVVIGHSTKIPMVAIEGFCRAAKDFCPPGLPGTPGAPGPVGPRGDPGHKGDRGERGRDGETGPRGYPGDKGPQGPPGLRGPPGTSGPPGLDGRDGIPGEPGLDGIPGRNGHDGAPGINGLPGRNGTDGIPGLHGYNGTKGEIGNPGPIGPPGARGIAGPRGRPGKPGVNGRDGTPGITSYQVSINGSKTSDLLMPPSIVGSDKVFYGGPITVKERDNVRLRCAATGKPEPTVQWRRLDVSTIELGVWKDSSLEGHLLNITRIRRDHMGKYMCIAQNGIPPAANQTFMLEVKFEPMIAVKDQHVRAEAGQNVTLKCDVEAFPEAVRYWKKDNMQLIESDFKYSISLNEDPNITYKSKMELIIKNIQPSDFGQYQCVAKNEIGKTTAKFQLDELDKNLARPPNPDSETGQMITYGSEPPERVALDDLCPPAVICPTCTRPMQNNKLSCKNDLFSVQELLNHRDLEVHVLDNYPGMGPRELNCLVYAVGKPVYHRSMNSTYGCWMKDSSLYRTEFSDETIWTTNETSPHTLYEFPNKTMFREYKYTRKYDLKSAFMGSSHVVFNGSFYYHQKDTANIICYELISRTTTNNTVPYFDLSNNSRLYTEQHNYMDFSVDDNGLWVIYGLANSNNTIVLKLQEKTLTIEFGWNISVVQHRAGEMFIVCGVLYVVDSNTDSHTHIRFALDLITNKQVEVDIPFSNPFKRTTMIGYNHKNKELYTWDRGNQLTYPIRYHDQGLTNQTDKEDKEKSDSGVNSQTTYEVDEKT